MKHSKAVLGTALWLCLTLTSRAAVPQLINYQGLLKNNLDVPVPNGSYSVVFTIYDAPAAGTNLWSETQSVTTSSGLFTVQLGIGPIPLVNSIFNDTTRYLGIKVGTDPEMTPRDRLETVPYSYRTSTVDGASGGTIGSNVGIGTSPSAAKLTIENSTGTGIYSSSTSGTGVEGNGISWGLYGYSPSGTGVVGASSGYGVVGNGGNYGVYGTTVLGTGVYGGSSTGPGMVAFGGTNGIYASGGTNGVEANSPNGNGVYANGGFIGVDATGSARGVSAFSGSGVAVYGQSSSSTAMYAFSSSGFGVQATGGPNGVVAYAINAGGAAVYGDNVSSDDYGGYFVGNDVVTGTLFKGGLAFKIDHPLDPSNKYLNHSGVESPDMKNIYDGVVTTDAQGNASVTLPDWFETLNKGFRYQLTVIGDFAQAVISEEIAGNQFSIKTDKSNVKVSWQVTGIRQDAYANAHRIPLEEKKTGREFGKYLHPIEHGVSETLGMQYEMTQKLKADRKQQEEQQAKIEAERKLQEEQRPQIPPKH